MNKVLMICYAFPPMGGSGVQRSLKFAKYLPENGWQPLVVAGEGSGGGGDSERDESLLAEFPPEGLLHRATVLDPLRPLRRLWVGDPVSNQTSPARPHAGDGMMVRFLRLVRRLWQTWAYIPDERAGWLVPALYRAIWTTRHHEIDVVYSSSDPYTAHLVAYLTSRVAAKPWVADFRDPWTQYAAHYTDRGPTRRRIDEFLERLFVSKADRVITATDGIQRLLLTPCGHAGLGPMTTITNGFDEDDFSQVAPDADKTFTLVYTGRFHSAQNESTAFLRAVRMLLDEHPGMAGAFKVRFAGSFGARCDRLVGQLALDGTVERLGYLPHREALRHLLQASALLLTIGAAPGSEAIQTGKVFEYLAARKPILAVVPEGAAAELIRETNSGVVVPPDDVVAIKNALYDFHSRYRDGTLCIPSDMCLDKYSRRQLTKKLGRVLDVLTQKDPSLAYAQ